MARLFFYFYTNKKKVYIAICLAIVILVGYSTGYNDYLILGALMLASYNMDFSYLAKVHVATDGMGKNVYPGPEYFDILYGKLFILDGLAVVIVYILITSIIMYKAYKLRR